MADDDTQATPNQAVIGLVKHLDAWTDANGQDALDAAVAQVAEGRRQRAKDARAQAAEARAATQPHDAAPVGRQTPAEAKTGKAAPK